MSMTFDELKTLKDAHALALALLKRDSEQYKAGADMVASGSWLLLLATATEAPVEVGGLVIRPS